MIFKKKRFFLTFLKTQNRLGVDVKKCNIGSGICALSYIKIKNLTHIL